MIIQNIVLFKHFCQLILGELSKISYIYIYIYIYTQIHIDIHMFVYMCICLLVYTIGSVAYIEGEREIEFYCRTNLTKLGQKIWIQFFCREKPIKFLQKTMYWHKAGVEWLQVISLEAVFNSNWKLKLEIGKRQSTNSLHEISQPKATVFDKGGLGIWPSHSQHLITYRKRRLPSNTKLIFMAGLFWGLWMFFVVGCFNLFFCFL